MLIYFQLLIERSNYQNIYHELIKQLNNFFDIREEYDKIRIIREIISKDGIQLYLLKRYLPMISEQVNDIIFVYLDKRIELELINDDIVLKIFKNNKIIHTLGGMENFVLDISLKIVIANISNIPQLKYLFIDENISVFDIDHINNIDMFFGFLKQYYNKIFIITHIESIKDHIDYSLIINKNNNKKSFINNLI